MKKYLYSLFALAAVLGSCTSDVDENVSAEKSKSSPEYILTLKPFEFEDGTRVKLTDSGSGINFAWSFTEVFGVFPIDPENAQAQWILNSASNCPDDDHYAKFTGEGWQLQDGVTYAAYQPYNGSAPNNTPYTAVPVSLPTAQAGTLSAIGSSYDYMWATGKYSKDKEDGANCPGPGNVVFDFSHAISIIKIVMPDQSGTVGNVSVRSVSNGNEFVVGGTMNVSTGVVTATSTSSSISLSSYEIDDDGNRVFYLATFPTTLENVRIDFTVDNDEFSYFKKLNTKTFKAGKAYTWNLKNWILDTPEYIGG